MANHDVVVLPIFCFDEKMFLSLMEVKKFVKDHRIPLLVSYRTTTLKQ